MELGQRILLHTSVVRLAKPADDRRLTPRAPRAPAPPPDLPPWQKIRMERVERNLTAKEVADRAKLSADDLRRIETGRLRDAPLVHRVDRVLGTAFFNEYLAR